MRHFYTLNCDTMILKKFESAVKKVQQPYVYIYTYIQYIET